MADLHQLPEDETKIIPGVSVFLERVLDENKSIDATEPSMTNSSGFDKDEDSNHDNIFKKLKQAQTFAQNQVQQCMAIAHAEIVRLRELHAETKRNLDSQIIAWRTRAETELNKRLQLEKEIKVITNETLRAEHIAIEANRQCEFLGRENAGLHEDLQAGRLKLAHVDAQRRDFYQQLGTLRATLGLLAREPLPYHPLSREQFPPPSAPTRSSSNFAMPENPQIQYPSAPVLNDKPATIESHSLPRPAWKATAWKAPTKKPNSSNGDDTAEVPTSPPTVESKAFLSDAYDDDFDISDTSDDADDWNELSDGYSSIDESIAEEICVTPSASSRASHKNLSTSLPMSSPRLVYETRFLRTK